MNELKAFNVDVVQALALLLSKHADVVRRTMFGYPAFIANGRMFACVYRDGIGLKVPETRAKQLLTERGIVPFQPHGKPRMREWIHVVQHSPRLSVRNSSVTIEALEYARSAGQSRKSRNGLRVAKRG